jgi:hypothetical protein
MKQSVRSRIRLVALALHNFPNLRLVKKDDE